jgi:hypothetical protein
MPQSIARCVENLSWSEIGEALGDRGNASTGPLLDPALCRRIAAWYDDDRRFRSRIVMARHGFGEGEYRYFAYPLPDEVAALRQALYPHLAAVANAWSQALTGAARYPDTLSDYLDRCHEAGQKRPTPLLLRYEEGGYNCLHQDLYGELVFPLQATLLLSEPGAEFEGGEFVLVEQRPRMQSRAEVVPLTQGEAVIFAVRDRPRRGSRGVHRVQLRHGVSRLRRGRRFALGIIFHDAT